MIIDSAHGAINTTMRALLILLASLSALSGCGSSTAFRVIDADSKQPISGVRAEYVWLDERWFVTIPQLFTGVPPKGVTRVEDVGMTGPDGVIVVPDMRADSSMKFHADGYADARIDGVGLLSEGDMTVVEMEPTTASTIDQ